MFYVTRTLTGREFNNGLFEAQICSKAVPGNAENGYSLARIVPGICLLRNVLAFGRPPGIKGGRRPPARGECRKGRTIPSALPTRKSGVPFGFGNLIEPREVSSEAARLIDSWQAVWETASPPTVGWIFPSPEGRPTDGFSHRHFLDSFAPTPYDP